MRVSLIGWPQTSHLIDGFVGSRDVVRGLLLAFTRSRDVVMGLLLGLTPPWCLNGLGSIRVPRLEGAMRRGTQTA